MKRVPVVLGTLLVVVIVGGWILGFGPVWSAAVAIDPDDHGGIQSLQLVPFPEGPDSPLFEREPSDASVPLSAVSSSIPDPLPAPRWQGLTCGMGGDLVVIFADGTSVRHGPCKRPESIDRLWSRMIETLDPGCRPRCGPG
jgi:hypothetical protein